jgi:hypothetical protein
MMAIDITNFALDSLSEESMHELAAVITKCWAKERMRFESMGHVNLESLNHVLNNIRCLSVNIWHTLDKVACTVAPVQLAMMASRHFAWEVYAHTIVI